MKRTLAAHRHQAAAFSVAICLVALMNASRPVAASAVVRVTEVPDMSARSTDDEIQVRGERHPVADAPATDPGSPESERQAEVWEPADCVLLAGADPILDTWCSGPQDVDLYEIGCPDGTAFAWPLKIRTRPDSNAAWGPWHLVNSPCIDLDTDDVATADPIATELARQIATLNIPAKHARIAPITDWFAVQTPMTYYTDAGTERLKVTVLGTAVELELTPTSYAWDPGDGCTPVHATKPGKRYPDQTTTHTYTKVGTYRVTLTTTWHGRFRIAGTTTWHAIEGTGRTTHTTAPFETREIRSVLTS